MTTALSKVRILFKKKENAEVESVMMKEGENTQSSYGC